MKPELKELFPYEYVSTGYFRQKGVPKGESAELLHGMQAIEYLYDRMLKLDKVKDL